MNVPIATAGRWATVTGVAILAMLWSKSAYAQKTGVKVVIFPLQSQGDDKKSEARAKKMTQVVARVSKRRGLKVNRVTASLDDTAMISGCEPNRKECRASVLGQLGAQRGMTGTVEAGPAPGRVRVTIDSFDRDGTSRRKQFDVSTKRAEKELEGALPVIFGDSVPPEFAANVVGHDRGSSSSLSRVKSSSWIIASSGAATMLAGSMFWLVASGQQQEIDEAPVATLEDLQRLMDLEERAGTNATVGNALFVTGAAVFVVGAVLVVRQVRSKPTAEKSARAITLAPTLARDGFGLGLHARF